MLIKFFKPYISGNELKYIKDLFDNRLDLSGDGKYTKMAQEFLEKKYHVNKVFLTTSGTTALELAVRVLDLKPGDEVIVPSFTFSSTVNAILFSYGVKVVFTEIQKDTLNIDPKDIKRKLNKNTKAIMVVHYAGVACDMDRIMKTAKESNLKVIEDAAQAIESKYKNKYLGTIGDFGCLSFHDTKNATCGEGGALYINTDDKKIIEKAEIIREKGTNRTKFFRGEVDKYTWVDVGSSILPSDILAAFLLAQLESIDEITKKRLKAYNYYKKLLSKYEKHKIFRIPKIPKYAIHNGHIFYVIFSSEKDRNFTMDFLRKNGVQATFHYIPLHSAPQGIRLGYKASDLKITENVSKCVMRFPLYADMAKEEIKYVAKVFEEAMKKLHGK